MKLVKYSQSKVFAYDSAEERLKHIKEMEENGWTNSGKVKEFTGRLLVDDVEDDKNYNYIGEFYREVY